ncbi:MAG TPA: TIGR03618 family F420-dependent PPOX class oxidoreductase [Acidimicrobiales bacterium]|nr:TIGR03618 family F420-dependent PPOX class oxidoreductase [Acidimicrobiales bacterium]
MADLDLVRRLGEQEHGLVVVSTTRADGTIQTSVVNAGVLDGEIAFVARSDTRKLDNIRRTGRAAVTFRSGWEWAAVEGPARIAGGDRQLLRDVFTAAGGTHDDWDEYDRVMAAEGRVAVFVTPARISTN